MKTSTLLTTCHLPIVLVALTGLNLAAATLYVSLESPNPSAPHPTWATAATTIQDAVDAAAAGDEIVVTNGVYATGGRALYGTMTNRVVVDKPITVRSVNGAPFTAIQGAQAPGGGNGDSAVRCVYLANGARLSGFTLTNGATRMDGEPFHERCGGGVWCQSAAAVVSGCVLAGNSAAMRGGGASSGTLNNCALTGNWAWQGGAVCSNVLNNCTLTFNSAEECGGGAYCSRLNNCIVYFNTARLAAANYAGGFLSYCCTTPQPEDPWHGPGNITLDPQLTSAFRLSSGSPCRGAGSSDYHYSDILSDFHFSSSFKRRFRWDW